MLIFVYVVRSQKNNLIKRRYRLRNNQRQTRNQNERRILHETNEIRNSMIRDNQSRIIQPTVPNILNETEIIDVIVNSEQNQINQVQSQSQDNPPSYDVIVRHEFNRLPSYNSAQNYVWNT